MVRHSSTRLLKINRAQINRAEINQDSAACLKWLYAGSAAQVAAASLLLAAVPAAAQDASAPLTLEDLIPDSAVANPEEWAAEGVNQAGAEEPELPELAPETPMAELPELSLDWPEQLEIPPLEALDVDQDIQFADVELPDVPLSDNAAVEKVSSELTIVLPSEDAAFPMRGEFIDRFKSLSAITELSGDDESIAQLAARARSDEALLTDLLRVYGYYDAEITRIVGGAKVGEAKSDRAPSVRFEIIPGQRYRFGAIDLGALDEAPDYPSLRKSFAIETGDPMSSDEIVSNRLALEVALGETGYPFAEVGAPDLLIDHARSEGDLSVPVAPNGKYLIASVSSSDPGFLSDKHLSSIARFDANDLYQRSLTTDLRRAVTATGLVSSVTVTPRELTAPTNGEPGQVVLDVGLTKAKLRTIAGAIGYGAEEGVRVQASWEHRNLFPSEGALKVRGIVGTREQLGGVTFRKNNFGGRDRVLTLDAFISTLDSDAFDAQSIALVGTYERASTLLFQKQLGWSVGFELIGSRERAPAVGGIQQPRDTFYVAALPASVLYDTTDSLLNPTKGFRLGGRFSPEISRTGGKQSTYIRTQLDASYYQSVNDRLVMAGRVRFGSIPGTSLDNIAPSRRYYAGGGSSVRGYGFQQIGPRDVAGAPSGGRSVVEAAVEARIKTGFFDGALSVVPFLDAGSIGPDPAPNFDDIRFGAGIGIRYDSGFGPLRVDVGVPLNPGPDDNPVAVYVSLGQAF